LLREVCQDQEDDDPDDDDRLLTGRRAAVRAEDANDAQEWHASRPRKAQPHHRHRWSFWFLIFLLIALFG
jgi:hypothetical protein